MTGHERGERGQANLPAVAVALLLLTATTGLAVSLADAAYTSADRDPADRRVASSLAERMVGESSDLTRRANVLDRGRLSSLSAATLDDEFPVAAGTDVRITLGDRTVLSRGDPTGGATVRRVVLVATEQSVTTTPPLTHNATTLPRRTDRVTLAIQPPPAIEVRTVRANDRVVLHEPSGLRGRFTVGVSRFETVRLTFETSGPLPPGSVEVTYYPTRTTKATLGVTVDA